MRALLVFDHYDKLDTMTEVFDIARYQSDRKTYFGWRARQRNDEYIRPLYRMLSEKYPDEVKKRLRTMKDGHYR